MGCTSQTRCLGPKIRERQVYIDLIETIYRQVEQIPITQNQDQYQFIKGALAKKGLLRKLTDNLKSHKSNIYSCVDQNFQISSQSKMSVTRITSLILVDKIMEELLKLHKNGQDESGNYRHTADIALSNRAKQRPSFGDIVEFDQRIDRIFLRQIVYLLQNQKQIEERVISSLMQFCQNKEDKIINKNEVYSIFQYLYKKASKKIGSVKYLKAFQLLLGKLKQNLKEQQKDTKYIKYFMSLDSSKQTDFFCQLILKKYLQKYFGEYSIFYQGMLELFDSYMFQGKRSLRIWQMMLNSCRQQQSYTNFMRGLFILVLRYIMVHQQLSSYSKLNYKLQQFSKLTMKNIQKQQCKLNAFKMITQWAVSNHINIDQTILYSSNLIVMSYLTNYLYGRSESIKEALKKQFYQIISLLNSKSDQIIIQLLVEQIRERQTLDKKRKMLIIVIKEILVLKKMLTNIDNSSIGGIFIIIEQYYSIEVKLQIINYMKFILKQIKSEYVNGTSYDSTNLRQRLCDFLYSLYASIIQEGEQRTEETYMFIKNNLVRKSKNQQDLNKAKIQILQKNKYTAQLISIIKILLEQHFYIIVVSFIDNINDAMPMLNQKSEDYAYILMYFIILIKRHTLFLVNKREKIPEEMIKLHLKIEDGQISNTTHTEIVAIINKVIDQCHFSQPLEENQKVSDLQPVKQKINALMRSDNRRISSAKQFYMFNQLEYSQVIQNFKQHFRLGSISAKKDGDTLSEMKLFHRNSQTNMSRQQLNRSQQHQKYQQDESFRDIIAKISQR